MDQFGGDSYLSYSPRQTSKPLLYRVAAKVLWGSGQNRDTLGSGHLLVLISVAVPWPLPPGSAVLPLALLCVLGKIWVPGGFPVMMSPGQCPASKVSLELFPVNLLHLQAPDLQTASGFLCWS